VRIEPAAELPIVRANQQLTCSAEGHPALLYMWIDNITGNRTYSHSHTLQPGEYNLTCAAVNNANCSLDNPICNHTDSAWFKQKDKTNFPFDLFKKGGTFNNSCETTRTITGHAIGMFTSWFRAPKCYNGLFQTINVKNLTV